MKITDIKVKHISVPLRTPFKTALRTVNSVEDTIVEIYTDTGNVGFGEAPPTGVITGDTTGAIIGAIEDHIKKSIIGMSVDNLEELMLRLNSCIIKIPVQRLRLILPYMICTASYIMHHCTSYWADTGKR